MTNRQAKEQIRKSVLVVFDEFYSSRDNLVGSYFNLIIKQLEGIGHFQCFTAEPYRGPVISALGRKIDFLNAGNVAQYNRGLWQKLKAVHRFEPMAFWTTNLTGEFEGIARLMFAAQGYHAVICFTQSTNFALAIARLAHVFSEAEVPHLFAVTRRSAIPTSDFEDLRWLNMELLHDAELAPSVDVAYKQAEAYMFVRPFSGMAAREIKIFLRDKLSRKFKFRRKLKVPHFSSVLHRAQSEMMPTKPSIGLPQNGKALPRFTFFDDKIFPLRAERTFAQVNWSELTGPDTPYPPRIRNIVLFVRPDWDASGSATSFNNFKTYFRENESLFIEIATWPYFVPLSNIERWDKVMAAEKHGRPAISFFLRRSGGPAQHLRALSARRKLKPKTLSGELLLYYVGTAVPQLMAECLKNAKFNTVFVNHYFTLEFIAPFIKGRKFYLDTHDIQATNAVHQMYRNPYTTRPDSFEDLLKEEVSYLQRAERMSFVSPDEITMVKNSISEERLKYFIPLPLVKPMPLRTVSGKFNLAFVASNNLANQQSMTWLLKEVWPLVLANTGKNGLPNFKLNVVGDVKEHFPDVELPSLKFLGRVSSLEKIYEDSDLILLPVVAGGGVGIKSLEAILYHKPIVATRHALRGLPDGLCESLQPVDEASEFAAKIVQLLTDHKILEIQYRLSVAAADRLLSERFYDRLTQSLDAVRQNEK